MFLFLVDLGRGIGGGEFSRGIEVEDRCEEVSKDGDGDLVGI